MTQRARSPVLGYNHNLRHGGRVFHVQTEDSGVGYARLYTHLFFEGTILSSKKQEYDPAASEDSVRGLMQQLHKAMIKELTHGGHDPHIAAFFASRGEPAVLPGAVVAPAPEAVVAAAQPELPAPVPEPPVPQPPPVAAPPVAVRAPAPRPKPVVVIKPGGLKRPPVVLSSSADGVVVRRNVVINVGAGEPPVNGATSSSGPPETTPGPGRPRAAAPIAVRDSAYGAVAPAARAPEVPPQPLAASQEIHMPWTTPAPTPAPTYVAPSTAGEAPARVSRQIRMPWDPPAPAGATDAFASDLVNDKSLDEVILEYLSDDVEPESR